MLGVWAVSVSVGLWGFKFLLALNFNQAGDGSGSYHGVSLVTL